MDQEQSPSLALTVTVTVPPERGTEALAGVTLKVQRCGRADTADMMLIRDFVSPLRGSKICRPVETSACLICATVAAVLNSRKIAHAAETCGAASDVPFRLT